jgi:hypothetical protein
MERAGVGLRVDADRLDAHLHGGARHPHGNLTPVGDQKRSDHRFIESSAHLPEQAFASDLNR